MSRRFILAISLFVLSPLVAEYLLGNVAIDAIAPGIFLGPMYGGGALLVREAARHHGRGWPTMFLLALAYGVVEEGLATQTLFNPSYFGLDLLRETYIPFLGIGVWWTLFVLTLHTVWSISVPIAIVEAFAPDPSAPWLGRLGLTVTSILFVIGAAHHLLGHLSPGTFHGDGRGNSSGPASPPSLLIVTAFALREPRLKSDREAPGPWKVGAFSLAAGSTFFVLRYVLGAGRSSRPT